MKRFFFFSFLFTAVISFGQTLSTTSAEKNYQEDKALVVVEEAAHFPGGDDAMYKFIANNFHYPKDAEKAGVEGTVYISFVVEKDGSLSDIKILKGVPNMPSLATEAVRVVSGMPKWVPAKNNGHVVRQQYNLPIKCILETKKGK